MDREWMYLFRTDKWYMQGVGKFLTDAKAHAGEWEPYLLPMQRLHESKEMGSN
jgi:hypothetical protein